MPPGDGAPPHKGDLQESSEWDRGQLHGLGFVCVAWPVGRAAAAVPVQKG